VAPPAGAILGAAAFRFRLLHIAGPLPERIDAKLRGSA
jgi:hypothetical protein